MTGRALLDVNVLVALFDPDHVHHDLAHDWFGDNGTPGWATCPLVENGFLRVLSNAAYPGGARRAADLVVRLRRFCGSGGHEFWPDEVSLRDPSLFNQAMLAGSRQITDVYLLGLAVKRHGRLVTFDWSIPVKAVVGATRDSLTLIGDVDYTGTHLG